MASITEDISAIVAQLPPSDQQRVLDFVRELANPPEYPHSVPPPGSRPEALLSISVDAETADAMERALEECEHIDPDEHGLDE